ncbi:hypothetical protein VF21_03650 [Pseudogymnoascus sp. 05NY08]|nr:hypothetical protein VF21_03650 [Pseudogymnoascus sp. 05NY08]
MNRSSSRERVRGNNRDGQSRLSMVSTAVSDGREHHGRFDMKREFERVNEMERELGRINKVERERIDDSESQKHKDRNPYSPWVAPPPGARIMNPYRNPTEAAAAHLEAKMPYRNIYYDYDGRTMGQETPENPFVPPRRTPFNVNTTERRYAADIKTAEPPVEGEIPYCFRDNSGKSDGRDLTRLARDQESYPWHPSPSYDISPRNKPSLRDQNERGRMRSVSREKVQSQARGSSSDAVNVIWNPSSPRDTTVHLELDVEDDIESRLEEFSRLVRLGHFKEAELHFERYLVDHIDLEPVLLEYTDMLLDRGNYTKDGSHKAPPPGGDGPEPAQNYGTESEHHALNNGNFGPGRSNTMATERGGITPGLLSEPVTRTGMSVYLRSAYREFHSMGLIKKGLKTVELDGLSTYINAIKGDEQPCSSDLQILQYYLKVLSYLKDNSSFLPPFMYSGIWSDRPGLYKSLLSDGRIWDARDIISVSVSALGEKHTWKTFVGADIYSSTFFADFLRDWNLEEYDESSYLATLDILATLGQSFISQLRPKLNQQTIEDAKQVLELARRFSTCIKDNNPGHIKSRPYLRWILAEAELVRHLAGFKNDAASTQKSLRRFPGLTVWLSALPIYIPISSENPGWCASTIQGNSTDLLHSGLKAAQDLGDYCMEASFLRELACRSEDPTELLAKLGNLQKLTQGDMVGYLQTCLTKYLLAHDEAQLQALRDELADFEDQLSSPPNFARTLENPLMEWCKRMIQSALFRFQEQFTVELDEAQRAARAVAGDLPRDMQVDLSNFSFYDRMAEDISISLGQGHFREDSELKRRMELEARQLNQAKMQTRVNIRSEEHGDEAANSVVAKYGYGQGKFKTEKEETEYRSRVDTIKARIAKKENAKKTVEAIPEATELDSSSSSSSSRSSFSDHNWDPIYPADMEPQAKQPVTQDGKGREGVPLPKVYDQSKDSYYRYSRHAVTQDKKKGDNPQVIEIDGGRQVEIDDRPQVEEINDGPVVETDYEPQLDDTWDPIYSGDKKAEAKQPSTQDEKGDGPQVEIDDGPQVGIVNPQTDDANHAADDPGNTKNTGSNGDNEAKGSEQDREMEPPQRRPTFAYVEGTEEDK